MDAGHPEQMHQILFAMNVVDVCVQLQEFFFSYTSISANKTVLVHDIIILFYKKVSGWFQYISFFFVGWGKLVKNDRIAVDALHIPVG